MIRQSWEWLNNQFINQAPLGTPQNPEILEPGEQPRQPPRKGRLRLTLTFLGIMAVVSAPAVFTIWSCVWLIDFAGTHDGAIFAWMLLVLFAPMTLVFSAGAIVIDAFLLLALFAVLTRRPGLTMSFSTYTSASPNAHRHTSQNTLKHGR